MCVHENGVTPLDAFSIQINLICVIMNTDIQLLQSIKDLKEEIIYMN